MPEARRLVLNFLETAGVATIPIGEAELALAVDAYDQYGKGRHPARLNMGDCFIYAAAMANDAALLHKDAGFWLTDVKQAMPRAAPL